MARITAQEARLKTDNVMSADDKFTLNSIDNNIKNACKEKQYHIWWYGILSEEVINNLKTRGYDIEDLSSENVGDTFKINW